MVIVTYRFLGAKAGFPSIAGAGCQELGLTPLARGVLLPGMQLGGICAILLKPEARQGGQGYSKLFTIIAYCWGCLFWNNHAGARGIRLWL